jgi:hypothetical protein
LNVYSVSGWKRVSNTSSAAWSRHVRRRQVGDALEQRQRHVLAHHRRQLEQRLVVGRQAVNARGENGLHRGRHQRALHASREAIGAPLAAEDVGLREAPHAFLEKEGVPLGPLDEQRAQRRQRRVGPQQALQQGFGGLGRERVEPNLGVAALAAPGVPVFGAIVDEQQHGMRRQALDQAVEQRLGVRVQPVQVLEDEQERLPSALTQQETLDGVEYRPPMSLAGSAHRLAALHEQRLEGGQRGAQALVEREDPPGQLLADPALVVRALHPEIALEQCDHRQQGGGPAISHRARLEHQPVPRAVGVHELPHQARLARARLADQSYHLPVAGADAVEAAVELAELGVPPNEARQAAAGRHLEPRAA